MVSVCRKRNNLKTGDEDELGTILKRVWATVTPTEKEHIPFMSPTKYMVFVGRKTSAARKAYRLQPFHMCFYNLSDFCTSRSVGLAMNLKPYRAWFL